MAHIKPHYSREEVIAFLKNGNLKNLGPDPVLDMEAAKKVWMSCTRISKVSSVKECANCPHRLNHCIDFIQARLNDYVLAENPEHVEEICEMVHTVTEGAQPIDDTLRHCVSHGGYREYVTLHKAGYRLESRVRRELWHEILTDLVSSIKTDKSAEENYAELTSKLLLLNNKYGGNHD